MDVIDEERELRHLMTLKARYFRLMDTKQWEEWRDLFTDDMQFWRDSTPVPTSTEPVTTTAEAFVSRVSTWLATAVTVHHGHMAELELTGADTARGIWALFDWVDNPGHGRAFQGYGHYHERYDRDAAGVWRIKHLRLTRLRIVELPTTPLADIEAARLGWLNR
jgi:hypothetical protein